MSTIQLEDCANGICEIRWHGRGGQGAVSSAKVLAAAAYLAGFKGVTSAPSFGAERRGAPVTASTRLAAKPIRVFAQAESPDVVVVLDDSLVETANATAGLRPGGWVIINSTRDAAHFGIDDSYKVATANASGAAQDVGLIIQGAPMVNTAMLGAIAKATGLVDMGHLESALNDAFGVKRGKKNVDAAQLTYERTRL